MRVKKKFISSDDHNQLKLEEVKNINTKIIKFETFHD